MWKCAHSQGSLPQQSARTDHSRCTASPRLHKARYKVVEVPDPRLRYTAAPEFKRSKSNPAHTLETIHLLSSVGTDQQRISFVLK
jgi:hypothetical protein